MNFDYTITSRIYEEYRLRLWNNCRKTVLSESTLPDEVEVFYQDHHQS